MKVKIYAVLMTVMAVGAGIALLACYLNRGWLTFQTGANIATIAATIVGATTLIAIAIQQRQQIQLARATNSQSFVNFSSQFVLQVASNDDLADLYLIKSGTVDNLPPLDKARLRYLVAWWLTFYENVVYQHSCHLLDEGVYRAWLSDMEGFAERRRVERVWDDLKDNYSKQFRDHFQVIIDNRNAKVSQETKR